MSKETREQKVEKTIKVKTVVISVAMFVTVVASFIGGWFSHVQYSYKVQEDASSMLSNLKVVR